MALLVIVLIAQLADFSRTSLYNGVARRLVFYCLCSPIYEHVTDYLAVS